MRSFPVFIKEILSSKQTQHQQKPMSSYNLMRFGTTAMAMSARTENLNNGFFCSSMMTHHNNQPPYHILTGKQKLIGKYKGLIIQPKPRSLSTPFLSNPYF